VEPTACLGGIAFNNERPLLRGNVALRRAINWALDRRALAAEAPAYSASPWTHLLPPCFPGSITAKKLQPYAGAPNLSKARLLAAGHLRSGKVNIGYRSSSAVAKAHADVVHTELIQLGIAPARIAVKAVSGTDIHQAMGKHGTDLDLGSVSRGPPTTPTRWSSPSPWSAGSRRTPWSRRGTAASSRERSDCKTAHDCARSASSMSS